MTVKIKFLETGKSSETFRKCGISEIQFDTTFVNKLLTFYLLLNTLIYCWNFYGMKLVLINFYSIFKNTKAIILWYIKILLADLNFFGFVIFGNVIHYHKNLSYVAHKNTYFKNVFELYSIKMFRHKLI